MRTYIQEDVAKVLATSGIENTTLKETIELMLRNAYLSGRTDELLDSIEQLQHRGY